MVATLPQLHHDVEQRGDGRGRSRAALRKEHEVSLEDGTVVLLLNGRQLNLWVRREEGKKSRRSMKTAVEKSKYSTFLKTLRRKKRRNKKEKY